MELIAFADSALRMLSTAECKARCGSIVWNEAVRMIASHLKWLQAHGIRLPSILDAGHIGQEATAELLRQVRHNMAADVVAEAERHAVGEEPAQ
jgi:hypothetical protein